MTHLVASHSFHPFQHSSASSRHSSSPTFAFEYDAPESHYQPAASYKRHVDELTNQTAGRQSLNAAASHPLTVAASLSAPSSSSSSSSFSPLSLCSTVSSCSSSSSSSSTSAYSSPADTFDPEEMGEDAHSGYPMHHPYFQPHKQHQQHHPHSHRHHKPAPPSVHQQVAMNVSRPLPSPPLIHHQPMAQDSPMYYPSQAVNSSPSTHAYGHHSHSPPPMTVSIPAANGGWKELPAGSVRRRETQLLPQAHSIMPTELPTYLPAPLQPVVAAAAEVVSDSKSAPTHKKKGRSLRRCMDREKHSKAEQKRRGEMKALFDQLQDISQCVYKDRIHILTLAIQTIQKQQDTITQLQAQVGNGKGKIRGVKKEPNGDVTVAVEASGYSSPSSSVESTSGKRVAVDAVLEYPATTVVKLEDVSSGSSPKKPRISPHPRTVVDLSNDVAFSASLPATESSLVPSMVTSYNSAKPLHASFSSSSLSTFVCPSAEAQAHYSWGMDEQPHTQYHTQHADQPVVNKSQLASHVMQSAANVSYPTPPGMSPVFSFTAHPQHWWPSPADSNKQ